MKQRTKYQHIVPRNLIREWCFREEHRPDSVFYLMNKAGEITLEKKRNKNNVFVESYFFEYNDNSVTNTVENKLSKLESDYASLANRLIKKQVKVKDGYIEVGEGERGGMLLVFAQIQTWRSLLVGASTNERYKVLGKIERFLDFYLSYFKKLSNEKLEQEIETRLSRWETGLERFKYSPKKRDNFLASFFSEPHNNILLKLINPNFKFMIRYYPLPIWPLPVFGGLDSLLGSKQAHYNFWVWPISPSIVFGCLSLSFNPAVLDKDYVLADFNRRFDNLDYLINSFLPGALGTYLHRMKLPVILSKFFVDSTSLGLQQSNFKKFMRMIALEQVFLEYENMIFIKQNRIRIRRESRRCLRQKKK